MKRTFIAAFIFLGLTQGAAAQSASQEVVSFASAAIDCYESEHSVERQRCEMQNFRLPQRASDSSDNFRLRLRDNSGRRWWVREGDVVFAGAAGGLGEAGSTPRLGRGVRAALDDRVRAAVLAGAEAPRGRAAARELQIVRYNQLQVALNGTGARVDLVAGDIITVSLPAEEFFGFDTERPPERRVRLLARVADILGRNDATLIDVTGYSYGESVNPLQTPQQVAIGRATGLAQMLTAGGVNGARIELGGVGDSQAIATNLTPFGRAQNRRVDITIRAFAAGRE